ncbi:MAG TPA: carboxypeptidase regulatory-like domain-containing protein [Methanocorpusculum sp.]|nr:carboxypeptidase regulatory-like domain-containing protein [Methanocorpusculum sp.]HJJ33218.1 carboxypeptidase regulatory-like domain-containing protein [Methanocorpusculum sp.]
MMKKLIAVLLFAAVILCGTGFAAADEPVTPVTFSVVVMGAENNYISEAEVVVYSDGAAPQPYKTNIDGSAKFLLIPGEYTVSVTKTGYVSQTKTITVNAATPILSIQLIKEPPVLVTVIEEDGACIEGAEVIINGVSAGKTDQYGHLNVSMIRGANNTIRVKAVSHLDYLDPKCYVSSEVTALQPIVLSLAKISPLILIYNENNVPVAGAAVSVDGKLITYSDSYGRAQLPEYTAGVTYTLSISSDGYNPYTELKEFTTDTSDFVVTLQNKPDPAAAVRITVKTDDRVLSGALVYFDGNNKGQTGLDGTYTTMVNPGTTVMISASADGYSGDTKTLTVQPGITNEVTILMKENIPTTLIGIGALAAIIVLLIVILIIVGYKKRSKKSSSGTSGNSYGPRQRRDSL